MALAIFKQNYKADIAEELLKEYSLNSEDTYYLFVGKINSWPSDTQPPNAVDAIEDELYAFRNSFFLKRITEDDVNLVINKFPWVTGQVYAEYTDNTDLFDESLPLGSSNFFVTTPENNIYKCLANNGAASSQNMPTGRKTIPIITPDGYSWKYMFSIAESDFIFQTPYKIPVRFANSTDVTQNLIDQYAVQDAAVNGSFDIVTVSNSGAQFPMGTTGAGLQATSSEVAGSTTINIGGLINPQESIYTGYTVKIVDGYGEGQVRKITGNTGSLLYVDSAWTIPPDATTDNPANAITEAQIVPSINPFGDGTGLLVIPTMDAHKRINGVEVITAGEGYTVVNYSVYPGITGPYTEGTLGQHRGNIEELLLGESTFNFVSSPAGGHGSDPRTELGANTFIIRTLLKSSEFDQLGLSSGNDFRQFGIIKNPTLSVNYNNGAYSNLMAGKHEADQYDIKVNQITGSNFDGQEFNNSQLAEQISGLTSTRVMGAVSKTLAKVIDWTAQSVGVGTLKVEQPSGDFLLNEKLSWIEFIEGNTASNADHTLSFGGSGANDGRYDSITQSASIISYFNQTARAYVTATGGIIYDSSSFTLDDVYYNYISGISGASFRTMNWSVGTTGIAGTGLVNGIDYLGVLTAGDYIYSSSGSTMGYITGITGPDLNYNSGEVLYIQNMQPVLRTDQQEEEIKIQIGF
jgi:hypothetical protein